jgi:hypothetical protein
MAYSISKKRVISEKRLGMAVVARDTDTYGETKNFTSPIQFSELARQIIVCDLVTQTFDQRYQDRLKIFGLRDSIQVGSGGLPKTKFALQLNTIHETLRRIAVCNVHAGRRTV